eukprot:7235-Ditylum_brightwellii.AAC.1
MFVCDGHNVIVNNDVFRGICIHNFAVNMLINVMCSHDIVVDNALFRVINNTVVHDIIHIHNISVNTAVFCSVHSIAVDNAASACGICNVVVDNAAYV